MNAGVNRRRGSRPYAPLTVRSPAQGNPFGAMRPRVPPALPRPVGHLLEDRAETPRPPVPVPSRAPATPECLTVFPESSAVPLEALPAPHAGRPARHLGQLLPIGKINHLCGFSRAIPRATTRRRRARSRTPSSGPSSRDHLLPLRYSRRHSSARRTMKPCPSVPYNDRNFAARLPHERKPVTKVPPPPGRGSMNSRIGSARGPRRPAPAKPSTRRGCDTAVGGEVMIFPTWFLGRYPKNRSPGRPDLNVTPRVRSPR